jgi:hypothetical protein
MRQKNELPVSITISANAVAVLIVPISCPIQSSATSARQQVAQFTHIQALGDSANKPSKNDIEAAKQTKKNVWVVSQSGLWSVDPSGNVANVYSDPDWMKKN